VQRQSTFAGRRSDVLTRRVHAREKCAKMYIWCVCVYIYVYIYIYIYIYIQGCCSILPPCISSVAARGWLWRETGGYDYPL